MLGDIDLMWWSAILLTFIGLQTRHVRGERLNESDMSIAPISCFLKAVPENSAIQVVVIVSSPLKAQKSLLATHPHYVLLVYETTASGPVRNP